MYGYETSKYLIPAQIAGDRIESAEEQRAANISDIQMYGLMRAVNRGHGVIATGKYSATFVDGNSSVTFSEDKPRYAVEALINQVYVYSINPFTFEGIPNNSTSYLYLRLVEQDVGSSSVERGEFIAYVSQSSTPPTDGILIATATTTGSTITVDNDPTGLITIPILADHIADSHDPHGTTLYQTILVVDDLSASGTASFNNIEADVLSGTDAYFTELLSGTGSIRFNSLLISGTSVVQGDVVINGGLNTNEGLSIEHNVDVSSGVTVDGRDISADGTTLDSHIADYDNPHLTTAELVSGISKFGDTLMANLAVQSGRVIDGIDISTLKFLIDGSDATGKHTHSELLPQSGIEKTLMSPEYNGAVISGENIGIITSFDAANNMNVYEIEGVGAAESAGMVVLRHGLSETILSTPNDFVDVSGRIESGTSNKIEIFAYDTSNNNIDLLNNEINEIVMTEKTVSFEGSPDLVSGDFITIIARASVTSGTKCYLGDMSIKRWEDYSGA